MCVRRIVASTLLVAVLCIAGVAASTALDEELEEERAFEAWGGAKKPRDTLDLNSNAMLMTHLMPDPSRTKEDVKSLATLWTTSLRQGGMDASLFAIDEYVIMCTSTPRDSKELLEFFTTRKETHYVHFNDKKHFRAGTEHIKGKSALDDENEGVGVKKKKREKRRRKSHARRKKTKTEL